MKDYTPVSRFLPDDKLRTLPIACRHVPLDQWLVTHVDTSWKVKDIKHWILSKCNAWGSSNGPQPPRFRPASPVTFSTPSRRSSLDSTSWAGTEEGDDDDWEVFASLEYTKELQVSADDGTKSSVGGKDMVYHHAHRSSTTTVTPEHAQTSARYTLFSYSSGYILEDEADLSWYQPRPFELLELHRAGAIVPLPRASPAYLEPYFESPVLVSERPHGHSRRARGARSSAPSQSTSANEDGTVQSHAVEWKPRWAILRSGVLNLCKDSNAPPSHKFPISSLIELSGPEKLGVESQKDSRIICAKFKRSVAASKLSGEDVQDRRRRRVSKPSSWLVLDIISQSAYESLLRILHRSAPHPLVSSFVPQKTTPKTPVSSPTASSPNSPVQPSTSPPLSQAPFFAPFGVQYPEWRTTLCARARNAGLGDVGPAMLNYLASVPGATNASCAQLTNFLHHLPRAPSISEGLRRQAAAAHMQAASTAQSDVQSGENVGCSPEATASTSMSGSSGWGGDDIDDEEDVESEVEWDGWVRDLARRPERPPLPIPLSKPPISAFSDPGYSMPASPTSSTEYGPDLGEGQTSPRVRTLSYASPAGVSPSASMRMARSRSSTVSASTITNQNHGYSGVPEVSTVATATALGSAGYAAGLGAMNSGAGSSSPYGFMSTTTTTTTITTYVERVPEPHADPHPAWHQQLRESYPPSNSGSPTLSHTTYGYESSSHGQGHTHPSNFSLSRAATIAATNPSSGDENRAGAVMSPSASSSGGGGSGNGLGIGNVRRIVRGVSIRNAFSTDRFMRGFEDALDFVDGR